MRRRTAVNRSEKNLHSAFIKKAEEVLKYKLFAYRASREEAPQIERLFRAAFEAGAVRAFNHLMALYPTGDVVDHLQEAVEWERREVERDYPKMLDEAKEDDHKTAEWSFTYGEAAEKRHVKLYSEALDSFDDIKDQDYPYFVCTSCGNIMEKEAPSQCPVCGTAREKFITVE
jgi:rubrerythrin